LSIGVTTGRAAEEDEVQEPWRKQSMTGLTTPWSRSHRLTAPILNAPMGGVAGGRLAAAVTRAGGLGMIGVGSAGSRELLEREVVYLQGLHLQFGVGLLDWASTRDPELLESAIAARPVLISVSFGDDWSWAGRVQEAGIATATQISNVASAMQATDAGIDVIVARGAEGGGHGEPVVGTLPLLQEVLDAVTVPVLAAGGISTGRGLAAVLAAGAAGAWMGTAFAACWESAISETARVALFQAEGTDTVTTTVFDTALGYPWPAKYPERVLQNQLWQRWSTKESLLVADPEARNALAEELRRKDPGSVLVNAGQGVGNLTGLATASEIIDRTRDEAQSLLRSWGVVDDEQGE
jgi:nitronate monooxygenase